jgi:hypothetical protein
MTTTCGDRQLLADAARVLAARRALEPVLERLADAPLDPVAVRELRSWLDDSYPRAAAALDRLRASDAAAPHPMRPAGPRASRRPGRHR